MRLMLTAQSSVLGIKSEYLIVYPAFCRFQQLMPLFYKQWTVDTKLMELFNEWIDDLGFLQEHN
jgi:hypothetical protein